MRAAGLNAATTAAAGVDYVFSGEGTATMTIIVPSPTTNSCQFTYSRATQTGGAITAAPAVTITQSACN